MNDTRKLEANPFAQLAGNSRKPAAKEDWEDWEEDEIDSLPSEAGGSPLIHFDTEETSRKPNASMVANTGVSKPEQPHRTEPMMGDRDTRTGRFVDPSALMALEGDLSGESSGFTLFKKAKEPKLQQPYAESKSKQAKKAEKAEKAAKKAAEKADKAAAKAAQLRGQTSQACSVSPINVSSDKKPSKGQQSVWSPDTEDGYFTPSPMSSTADFHAPPQKAGRLPAPLIPTKTGGTAVLPSSAAGTFTPAQTGQTDARGQSRGWWDDITVRTSATSEPPVPEFQPEPIAQEWWQKADAKQEVAASHTGSAASHAETLSEKARSLAEENRALEVLAMELPPPYAEKQQQALNPTRYRAAFPTDHALAAEYPPTPTGFPPSPRTVSPDVTRQMTGSGAISMMDLPAVPPPVVTHDTGRTWLPDRELGTVIPEEHALPVNGSGPRQQAERRRRRHELEDYWAGKVLAPWRGRGPFNERSYLGKPGREGRKRRRICFSVCGAVFALTLLAVVLAVVLTRRTAPAAVAASTSSAAPVSSAPAASSAAPAPFDPWLNLTDYPPIPTGVLTVVGPNNEESISGCVAPSTLWSCDLPPEQQEANEPFAPSQPMFILQIQYDNSSAKLWNVTGEAAPTVTTTASATSSSGALGQGILGVTTSTTSLTFAMSTTVSTEASTATAATGNAAREIDHADGNILASLISRLFRRSSSTTSKDKVDAGFSPSPEPPSFQEMWFLGNWTDGIVSDLKAGEPTPFYISVLPSLDSSEGANVLNSRRLCLFSDDACLLSDDERSNGTIPGEAAATNLTLILPAPELNRDGTGAAARALPSNVVQQPLRLFDRGLVSEHYGFYTYFNKTIYVQSVSGNGSAGDAAGGSNASEARQVAYFGDTRFLVQIWTRLGYANTTTTLMGGGARTPSGGGNDTQPGTFPYPVTVTVDNHGGPSGKWAWWYNVTQPDRKIDTLGVGLIDIDYNYMPGGDSSATGVAVNVNAYGQDETNPSYGGAFGGSGGCKCTYQNFNFTLPNGQPGFIAR